MGALSRLRPLALAVSVASGAHLVGSPDVAALAAGLLVGLASLRSPPRAAPAPPLYTCPEPNLDLGAVVQAPSQPHSLWSGQRFCLALAELGRHVTVIGVTGSGKTTTLARLIDAALAAGWPVLVVDAKGGRLVDVTQALGQRHQLPARVWLPGHPDSWTYDVCAGDPTALSNRLVGAFEYGFDGQVFRNLAQAIVPLVISGMLEAGLRDRPGHVALQSRQGPPHGPGASTARRPAQGRVDHSARGRAASQHAVRARRTAARAAVRALRALAPAVRTDARPGRKPASSPG